jgi:uncharacterized protein YmfQ (DUF2313 family)
MTMRAEPATYRQLLTGLLPQGDAWSREPGSVLGRLLEGFGAEPARAHNRLLDLLDEADPRTTLELLPEWERFAGLPDPCSGLAPSLAGRREQLTAKVTQRGGQTPAYFIGLAASLGFVVTITEFPAFDCGSDCDAAVNGPAWLFAWQVNAPETTISEMGCESFCDEPLRHWGNEPLECALSRLKPAHTHVMFAYGA